MQSPKQLLNKLQLNVGKAIISKDEVVGNMLITLLCKGHLLIEDVPGVGKTAIASALARSLDCEFRRIQFTPDIMPSDITGYNVANLKTDEVTFKPGLVMSQIVLADEINRTSPKVQSALLEVMEENQVTVDGKTYIMPSPFCVLATQNPVEFVGTYPLPEAQLDRFLMRVNIGYPTIDEEMEILKVHQTPINPASLSPVCSAGEIIEMQNLVSTIYAAPGILNYIAQIVAASRENPALQLGVSPRGSISLMHASQACAMLDGRDYVLPDDVQKMGPPVITHRMILTPEARLRGQTAEMVLDKIMASIRVPVP